MTRLLINDAVPVSRNHALIWKLVFMFYDRNMEHLDTVYLCAEIQMEWHVIVDDIIVDEVKGR